MDDETHQMNPICSQQLDVVWWGFLFYTKVNGNGGNITGTPKLLNKIIKTPHLLPKRKFQFFGIRKEVNK